MIMIQLKELSKIVERKEEIDQEAKIKREKENKERCQKEYENAILNLEERLINAATMGRKSLSVAHFSAFSGGNVSEKLHSKSKGGNYYVSWGKSIFGKDVIEHMEGNLKRVYDYLQENGLDPKIEYWTDGGGQDEGFELVIKW